MELWNRIFRRPEGEPGTEGGAGGDPLPPPPRTIPVDALPEELRDLSERELTFFLSRTLSGVREQNAQNRALAAEVAELRSRVEGTAPRREEEDPHKGKSLAELILEDPEAAIEQVARKKGWIKGMEDVDDKASDALFSSVASKIDDFEEYEDTVREMLRRSNSPINRATIIGAYTMAVGQKAIEGRAKAGRKSQNPEPPAPPKPPAATRPEESDLEREIREAHGKSPDEWAKHKEGEFAIKLPKSKRA